MVGFFKKSPEQVQRKKALARKKELKILVKEKKYEQILTVGSEILEKIPHDLDVLFIVGSIFYMKKKYKTAISYFDRLLEISEYDPEILLLKANSLFELAKVPESIQCCEKIKEIDPKNKGVAELLSKIESSK